MSHSKIPTMTKFARAKSRAKRPANPSNIPSGSAATSNERSKVPVRLNEQGKARRVSTQEAALLRLREMALKGDARSLDRLLALAQIFNNGAATESLGDKTVAAEL